MVVKLVLPSVSDLACSAAYQESNMTGFVVTIGDDLPMGEVQIVQGPIVNDTLGHRPSKWQDEWSRICNSFKAWARVLGRLWPALHVTLLVLRACLWCSCFL